MILPLRPRAMWPFFFLCLGVTAVQAADLSARTEPGQELLLATYYEIDPRTCRPMAPPRVRLSMQPALGRATVVRADRQPVHVGGRCGTMTMPVVQVRYRAAQQGTDTVGWEVQYQARGATTRSIRATVRIAPGAAD